VADAGLQEWIRPQMTELVDEAPDGPEWLHGSSSTATECMRASIAAQCGC
jgi:hypothetical protein